MEIKKSAKADLEGGRGRRLVLGLVVALSLLYVALEYNFSPDDPLDDPELLEMLDSDEELAPLFREENLQALAPKAEPEPAVKLKVVEEEDETEQEEPERQQEQPMEGDVEDDLPEPDEQTEPDKDDEVISFRVVEDLPQFPGGYQEFMKWLTRNLKYPKQLEEQKLTGRVVAEFIVNKDGSITDVNIVGKLHPLCDAEVLRVLRSMPRWTAGVLNGEPCRTKVCIPVVFRI